MTDKELLQQALEALDDVLQLSAEYSAVRTALRDRLALSYVPKVWMQCPECGKKSPMPDPDHKEWQGLNSEEAEAAYNQCAKYQEEGPEISGWFDFARAIEAKLKEKNTSCAREVSTAPKV